MTESKDAVGSLRPGGRTSRTRYAVLTATRDLLVTQGSAGVRVEAVAARSGVHRSSIYRRWGDVPGVIADLAADIDSDLHLPAHGTLAAELHAIADQLAERLAGNGAALARALLAWNDPAIRAVLDDFWHRRRQATETVLGRHGNTADAALVTRILAGPLFYEALVEGRAPTSETIAAATAAAVRTATGQ